MGNLVIPPSRIEDYDSIKKFIFAGKAIFTILDTRSDKRITYEVQQGKRDGKKTDLWFVKAKVDSHYKYFSYINSEGDLISGKNPQIDLKNDVVLYFKAFYIKLKENNMPDFIHFWHEGVCAKCGLALTKIESIVSGFGPVCLKKIKKPNFLK